MWIKYLTTKLGNTSNLPGGMPQKCSWWRVEVEGGCDASRFKSWSDASLGAVLRFYTKQEPFFFIFPPRSGDPLCIIASSTSISIFMKRGVDGRRRAYPLHDNYITAPIHFRQYMITKQEGNGPIDLRRQIN